MGSTHTILRLVLERLDSNWVALVGRLVCKDASIYVQRGPKGNPPNHCTVRLSLPLPPSALDAAWRQHVQQALREASERVKCELLPTAVSSGSETNLELACGVLRPCLFPELLTSPDKGAVSILYTGMLEDPGEAAIVAGHAHLLPWMVQNRCPVHQAGVLSAAAEHLDLEGMQWAMQLLGLVPEPPSEHELRCKVAKAAARSGDTAIPKLAWLLSAPGHAGTQLQQQEQQQGQQQEEQQQEGVEEELEEEGEEEEDEQQELLCEAALGAAEGGSLSVLQWLYDQWLHDQGLDLDRRSRVLSEALQHGHLHVADWVAAQGFPQEWQAGDRLRLWKGAGMSGSMEPARWLLRNGVLVAPGPISTEAIEAAAGAGNLEAVQLLHKSFHVPLTWAFSDAAASGSVPTATWLLQAGCRMTPTAYMVAALRGCTAMVLWLAREARCPWEECTLADVIRNWPSHIGGRTTLLQTVRALVEAGCRPGEDNSSSICNAAARGDLPLLRYLHEELGLGLGPGTMDAAVTGGCEAMLEWLVGAGCEPGFAYVRAAAYGDLSTLSGLHRLGVPFADASWWWDVSDPNRWAGALCWAPLAALRWMVERGAPWSKEGAKKVLESDRMHVDEESLSWFKARMT